MQDSGVGSEWNESDNELYCDESYVEEIDSNKDSNSPKKLREQQHIDEEVKCPVRAIKDPKLLNDLRILKNLLKSEKICVPVSENYLQSGIQPDLNPGYQKIVTEWMLQVCQECGCSPDVFMLAVNFMDRFLAITSNVPKSRLQLIGTVCLLISSKFKETSPLPGERLIHYTDNSITPDEIRVSEIHYYI